jgi:hypothetical protein
MRWLFWMRLKRRRWIGEVLVKGESKDLIQGLAALQIGCSYRATVCT